MKILVTGHQGYLGSEFCARHGKDFDIVGYDIKSDDDTLDYPRLVKKMKGCEQVVHLAAIPKPIEGKSFQEYFDTNCRSTLNILQAAVENGCTRVIYASSTTVYGIERGIPFKTPITENQPFVSQYLSESQLKCRDVDLSYHVSKVIAEQILAWYGLNKKIQAISLRFGPIDKVFLDTSVSMNNAVQALRLAIESRGKFWYEPFSIVDELPNIDITKAKRLLGYTPERPHYTDAQRH